MSLYDSLSEITKLDPKTAGMDKEQIKILGKMNPDQRDEAMNAVFFAKYDHLFGAQLAGQRKMTIAERALVIASGVLNLTKDAAQLPLAHSLVLFCSLYFVFLRI